MNATHSPGDDDYDDLAALDFSGPDQGGDDHDDDLHLSTVSNPPGTVTVSAFMNGRVHKVELSPRAAAMSESELAEEIVVIAELARRKARSAQHEFVLENMGETAPEDRDMLAALVGQSLRLPTPEQAAAAEAEVFATRYPLDRDGE